MSPRTLDRRRLLTAGGTVAGLAALGGRAHPGSPEATATASGSVLSVPPTTPASLPFTPTLTPSPRPKVVTPVEAPRLAARLDDYLDGRRGDLGLELVDLRRGQSFSYDVDEGYCYSTIKVLVLTTLLHQLQQDDKHLSTRQRRLAERMITRSDNGATESLLAEVGRDEVRRVGDLVGMANTHLDDGWWGLWRTTPGDLNRMVGAVLSSDAVLDGARRATARFLMADVVPEQRWGVFATESSRVHVAAKNGWGPLTDGYRLNSAGWVFGDGREYQLAILSNSPSGFQYGRRTISAVADICHRALKTGLA